MISISDGFKKAVGTGKAFLASIAGALTLSVASTTVGASPIVLKDFDGDPTTAEGVYDPSTGLTWGQGGEITNYATANLGALNFYGHTSSLPTASDLYNFLYGTLGNSGAGITDLVNDPNTNWSDAFTNPGENLSWVLSGIPGTDVALDLSSGAVVSMLTDPNNVGAFFVEMQGEQGQTIDPTIPEPGSFGLAALALAGAAGAGALGRRRTGQSDGTSPAPGGGQ